MNVLKIHLESNNSYITQRKNDIEYITKILKKNPNTPITYSKMDNWIMINGVIVNAITKNNINEIKKSLNINMPEEGGQ